jgi:hypothetical protein
MESLPNEILENVFIFLPKTYKQRFIIISTCRRWNEFGYAVVDCELKNNLIKHLCDYAFLDKEQNNDVVKELKSLVEEFGNGVMIGQDLTIEIGEKIEILIAKFRYNVKGAERNDFNEFSCTKVFPHILSKLNDFYSNCCHFQIFPDTLTYRLPSQ